MSDPHWRPDPVWVLDQISWVRRFAGTADLRALLGAAEGQVRKFGKERRPVWEDDRAFGARREAEWDRVLVVVVHEVGDTGGGVREG